MNHVYAPGCALMLYKPHLSAKVLEVLARELGSPVPEHLTCCHHEPGLPAESRIVNTCAGCDRRYRGPYEGISTISLWEILAGSPTFPFPDYHGAEMTVHDACPTRTEPRVHDAVRELLGRMNIRVVEAKRTRTGAVCCGDSLFGSVSDARVKAQMRERAKQMPREDVVVYCVSCIKAMHVGGKQPRYLLDLLFGEDTGPGTSDPTQWHAQLDAFVAAH